MVIIYLYFSQVVNLVSVTTRHGSMKVKNREPAPIQEIGVQKIGVQQGMGSMSQIILCYLLMGGLQINGLIALVVPRFLVSIYFV